MPIFEYNKLKDEQIKDIGELISICNTYEGLNRIPLLSNDNLYEDMKSYYLYYEKNELISVLIIEQLQFSEAEITGYTLPALRRQGYFYKLLENAMDELAYFDIFKILFVVESKSKSGTLAAQALAEYDYSEYMLLHDLSTDNMKNINANIRYKKICEVCDLNKQAAKMIDKESILATEIAIQTKDMVCFEAYLDNAFVGICNVSFEMERAYLFGLYVIDNYRRQKIGYSFVMYILDQALQAGKKELILQVGNNLPALKLYLKMGFSILEQYDYYVFYTEDLEDN